MMEPSEMFLWVWAVGATILAIWFKNVATKSTRGLIILTLGMRHIAEGKAELTMVNGEMMIKKVEEKNV